MIRDYRDDELRGSVTLPAGVKEAVRKSCLDPSFKNRLLGQPTETLKMEGFETHAGIEVEVLQDTDEVVHLILPFNGISPKSELSDSQLALVVGGGRKSETAKSIYS